MEEKTNETKQETNTEAAEAKTAEEDKGTSLQVVASVFYKDDILSFTINFPAPDDRFVDKAIDMSQSLVHVFSQQQLFGKLEDYTCKLDKLYLNTYTVLFSGLLKLVDEPPRSAAEIANSALEMAALELVRSGGDSCKLCAMYEKCNKELAERGDEAESPSVEECAEHIAQYFLEQAKK